MTGSTVFQPAFPGALFLYIIMLPLFDLKVLCEELFRVLV